MDSLKADKLQGLITRIVQLRGDTNSKGGSSSGGSPSCFLSSVGGEKSDTNKTSLANDEKEEPYHAIPRIIEEDKENDEENGKENDRENEMEIDMENDKKKFKIDYTAAFCTLSEVEVDGVKKIVDGGHGGFAVESIPDDLLRLFHDTFELWICSGAAVDGDGYAKYFEVALREGNMTKADVGKRALSFFSQVLDTFEFPDFADTGPFYNAGAPRRVYVAAQLAHPRGYIVGNVMKRTDAALGLYVSFFGVSNPRMCASCERMSTMNNSMAGEPVLVPFPACISLSRVRGGTCSNCTWDDRDDCSWKSLDGNPPQTQPPPYELGPLPPGLAASDVAVINRWVDDTNATFAPGGLNELSCPRITSHLTDLEVDQRKRQKALDDAKRKILETELEATVKTVPTSVLKSLLEFFVGPVAQSEMGSVLDSVKKAAQEFE